MPSTINATEVYLSYVKFYERALIDTHDIARIDCVYSLAKKYYKTIPMAVTSNEKTEDIIQLLTRVGILHMFDVVIAHDGESHSNFSQEAMFANAAKRLNQRMDACLGKECCWSGVWCIVELYYLLYMY